MTDRDRRNDVHDPDVDLNPFVAFRRFADAQFATLFDQVDRPFKNPRQKSTSVPSIEDDSPSRHGRPAVSSQAMPDPEDHLPDLWRLQMLHNARMSDQEDQPGMCSSHRRQDARPGLLGRALGFMGKTTRAEEMERAEKMRSRDAVGPDSRSTGPCHGLRAGRDSRDGFSEDHISRSNPLAHDFDNIFESHRDAIEPTARLFEQVQDEIRSRMSEAIRRRIASDETSPTSGTWHTETSNSDRDKSDRTATHGPYSWSWTWGPWQYNTSREVSADDSDKSITTKMHTFGPWNIGPFHVEPLSTTALIPAFTHEETQATTEKAVQSALDFFDKIRDGLDGNRKDVHGQSRRIGNAPGAAADVESENPYDPVKLARDEETRYELPWLEAFQDLTSTTRAADTETSSGNHGGIYPFLREEAELEAQKQLDDNEEKPYNGVCPFLRDEAEENADTHQPLKQADLSIAQSIAAHLRECGLQSGAAAVDEYCQLPRNATTMDGKANGTHIHDREDELDYYERREPRGQHTRSEPDKLSGPLESGLLGTVTQIERKLLPDGSTTTTRRTKLRFADGREVVREENQESPAGGVVDAASTKGVGFRSQNDIELYKPEDRRDDEGWTQALSRDGRKMLEDNQKEQMWAERRQREVEGGVMEQQDEERRRESGRQRAGGGGWFW